VSNDLPKTIAMKETETNAKIVDLLKAGFDETNQNALEKCLSFSTAYLIRAAQPRV